MEIDQDKSFTGKAGLCGMPAINFYKGGENWEYYVKGGNGTKIGTCFPNAATVSCGVGYLVDRLVWYGYPCGE